MAKTKRHSPDERRAWAERWQASSLSGREFAKQNGLEAESVYRWGKEFSGKATKPKARSQAFTEVRVGDAGPRPEPLLEVALKNERVLRVPAGTDAGCVRALVEALESC